MADQYVKPGPYITALPPDQESGFQAWVKKSKVPFDPSSQSDYDMRGFFKDNILSGKGMTTQVNKNDGLPHFTDQYKTPFHQSFSNESQYATPDAPRWINDHQLAEKNGNIVFDEKKLEGQRLSDYSPIVTPEMRRLAAIGGPPPVLPVAPVMSGGIPQLPAPLPPEAVLTPTARDLTRNAVGRDQQELTRLTTTGSGVDQILHPTDGHQIGGLRRLGGIAAKIGDTALSVLAPGVAAAIPGTSMHHLQLERQTNARLGSDLGAGQQEAQTTLLDAQPALKQAALENQTLKTQGMITHQQDMLDATQQFHNQTFQNNLRNHGYTVDETDPTGQKTRPLRYDEMSEQQQAIADLNHAREEQAEASAALKKAQNDPTSPAFRLLKQRADAASQNANTAIARLSRTDRSLDMRREMLDANLKGVGPDGRPIAGAAQIAGDDGQMQTVGLRAASNAIKQQKSVATFNDLQGSTKHLRDTLNALHQSGGSFADAAVVAALQDQHSMVGKYVQGKLVKGNLTNQQAEAVAAKRQYDEQLGILRSTTGGTAAEAQAQRMLDTSVGAGDDSRNAILKMDEAERTLGRLSPAITSVSGGLSVHNRPAAKNKAADPLGIR